MDLYEAMRCAPTSRRFTDEPVAREALVRALDSARFAPSGGNRQGWRVVVVRDAGLRGALGELYLPQWRAYMEQTGGAQMLEEPDAFDAARVRMVRRADEYAVNLAQVPVHLVVGVRLEDLAVTDAALPRQSIVGGASVYPFVQNLLLALRAEGLGAALTTLLVPAEAEVSAACWRSPRTSRSRRTSASGTAPIRGRSASRAGRSRSSHSPSASESPSPSLCRAGGLRAVRTTQLISSCSSASSSGSIL